MLDEGEVLRNYIGLKVSRGFWCLAIFNAISSVLTQVPEGEG